jgi:hypothetical protein
MCLLFCCKSKKPAGVKRVSGLNLIIAWLLGLKLRRHPGHRMMMVMATVQQRSHN